MIGKKQKRRQLRRMKAKTFKPKNKGFTLIEVLVALALFALLVSLIQGVYSGVLKGQKHIREETERSHMAAYVLDRMLLELGAAFVSNISNERFEETGFLLEEDSQDNAKLSFTTRLPGIQGFLAPGEAAVRYILEPSEDGAFFLMRSERRKGNREEEIEEQLYELLTYIAWFKVKCFDPDNPEGLNSWDSQNYQQPPYEPQWISLELAWGEKGKETVLRTSTRIYNRPL